MTLTARIDLVKPLLSALAPPGRVLNASRKGAVKDTPTLPASPWKHDEYFRVGTSRNGIFTFEDTREAHKFLLKKTRDGVLAKCKYSPSEADVLRVLHKYVASDPRTRIDSGIVRKDFHIERWDAFIFQVAYELDSETANLTEIDCAEIVSISPRVQASVLFAVEQLSICLKNQLTIKLAVENHNLPCADWLKNAQAKLKISYTDTYFDRNAKLYRPYVVGLDKALTELDSDRTPSGSLSTFEKCTAIFHDQLQLVYDFFGARTTHPHPLGKIVSTLVDDFYGVPIKHPRSSEVDRDAKAYAKKMNVPSEMGPSYTTVRVCQINEAITQFKDLEMGQKNVSLFDPLLADERKAASNPILSTMPVARTLTDEQRKDLVWAMFAYWTLHYHKSAGAAHTYFEVRDAAEECGIILDDVSAHHTYPDLQTLADAVEIARHVPTLATHLRKRAFKMGISLGSVMDMAEMVAANPNAEWAAGSSASASSSSASAVPASSSTFEGRESFGKVRRDTLKPG